MRMHFRFLEDQTRRLRSRTMVPDLRIMYPVTEGVTGYVGTAQ